MKSPPFPSAPRRNRPGSGLVRQFAASDAKRAQRRRKELNLRFQALRAAGRDPSLASDSRAFLALALGRIEALLARLPAEVREQELTLSWLEGLLGPMERQAAGFPAEVAPFATQLPTTVAEEERRRNAMSLLEVVGARLRRERQDILAGLDEVEASLQAPTG